LRLQHEVGEGLALPDCRHALQFHEALLRFELDLFCSADLRFVFRLQLFDLMLQTCDVRVLEVVEV